MKSMSPREAMTERIYDYLVNAGKFNAPYGVLRGIKTPNSGRGKARTITFGFARTMDATLTIWGVDRLQFDSNYQHMTFESEQEFYDFAADSWGTPQIGDVSSQQRKSLKLQRKLRLLADRIRVSPSWSINLDLEEAVKALYEAADEIQRLN